jgi:adenine phosphoribosyltransferase
MSDFKSLIVDVPDFPKPGIIFRDISPLLRERFADTIHAMAALFETEEWRTIDVVGGIESRGFILAAGLAMARDKGFVKIRKKGKLPGKVAQTSYQLEYGHEALEMQYGQGRMLIIDDVLATGGTIMAAADLAKQVGYEVVGFSVLLNLKSLNQFVWQKKTARALVEYE